MKFIAAVLLLFSANAFACLEAPLPTTPTGETWSATYERSGEVTEVTAWRVECPSQEDLLLITFEPIVGAEFVCSVSFDVLQNDNQFTNFRLLTDPSDPSSGFCNSLLVKGTFAVYQRESDLRWDTSEPFKLAWNSDVFLTVGMIDQIFKDRFSATALPTDYCLEWPLPKNPIGPKWTATYESSGDVTEVTAWRYECSNGEVYLLVTFEPIVGTDFVCSVSFDVVQNSVQYDNFRLLFRKEELSDTFCSSVLVPMSFVVGQRSNDPQWDIKQSFSLFWNSTLLLEVEAF